MEVGEFVEKLYRADSFEAAFELFDQEIKALGFEAVLYTLIPQIALDQLLKPVYAVSENFSPEYLQLYKGARYDRHDPLIAAVKCGEDRPLDWSGTLLHQYVSGKESKEVISAAFGHGIRNGLTIPIMSDARGVSGASIISNEPRAAFLKLLKERQAQVKLRTEIFHSVVLMNAGFANWFMGPVIESISSTERAYLALLASGNSSKQAASELQLSEKYLEQVMLKIRRKLSGVGRDETPQINRNQVLFYAGMLNLLH